MEVSTSAPVQQSPQSEPAAVPAPAQAVDTAPAVEAAQEAPAVADPAVAEDTSEAAADALLEDSVPAPAAPAPAAPVAAPEPVAVPQFSTVASIGEAIQAGQVPPHVQPYLRAALETMRPLEGRVQAAEAEYSQAKERFLKAAAELESQPGGTGAKALAGKTAELVDNLEGVTSDLAEVSLNLFEARHPEYKDYPDSHPVRVFLGKMWADGSADRLFTGKLIDKMEQAYQFALYQTKSQPVAGQPKPAPKPAAKPASPPIPVNEGNAGTRFPKRDVDEVSVGELLAQHDHLL